MIVDSDQTASQILEIMNRKKMPGEVTFLPLNKLRNPPVNYPPDHAVRIQRGMCVTHSIIFTPGCYADDKSATI